ncbi:inner membrane protein [Clostridium moniliforme]|uniref:Inner membrane protein n=1 Tax=Clostridium moniliforme TaxID=39489 RepID=A0ABS4F2S1_9CLOT|nr:metal-dependent hydrolase [Clostridium moniliforme]MBP1890544.1 inner membrane protein [Clostridium moniliforme]
MLIYNVFIIFKKGAKEMTRETHSSGGFLIALTTLNPFIEKFLIGFNKSYILLLMFVYLYSCHIGSFSPDIDMKSSYISKRHPLLSKYFGSKFKHRGFTHSLLFLIILFLICKILITKTNENVLVITICYGFLVGYISHLILDLITKEGIELLYPIKFNFKIFFIKTNSNGEKYFNKVLKLFIFVLVIYNIFILSKNLFNFDIVTYLNLNKFIK